MRSFQISCFLLGFRFNGSNYYDQCAAFPFSQPFLTCVLRTDISSLFTEKTVETPSDGHRFAVYPWIVGFVFFYPAGFVFSPFWFFYLFRQIATHHSKYVLDGTGCMVFPYLYQQTTGGWLGLLLIALWLTRKHLKKRFSYNHFEGVQRRQKDAISQKSQ